MKSTEPFGGGLVRSDCSYAAISLSQRAKLWFVSAHQAARAASNTISEIRKVRFMNEIVEADVKPWQADFRPRSIPFPQTNFDAEIGPEPLLEGRGIHGCAALVTVMVGVNNFGPKGVNRVRRFVDCHGKRDIHAKEGDINVR